MADIAARVGRLEDRAEVHDLVVRYFLAADGDDLEGLRACFATDASFAIAGWVGGSGRENVIAFLVEQRRRMGLTLHTPSSVLVTFRDDDRADGLIGAQLEMVIDGVTVFGAVRYRDTYVREGDAWRIAARDMRTVHLAPWNEVGEAMASATPSRWPGAPPAASDFPRDNA